VQHSTWHMKWIVLSDEFLETNVNQRQTTKQIADRQVYFRLEMPGNGFLHSHSLPFPCNRFPFLLIPSHSHSQFCNQFPFPWDSHKAFPIPSHSHSRTLHRCSINYFWAREDSGLNMPLKLTISCVHFYCTETRKIVVENIISFDLWFA